MSMQKDEATNSGPEGGHDAGSEQDAATTADATAENVERLDTPDLAEQLEEARRKAEENWERCLRTAAELDNVRKRAAREKDQARNFAIERFAKEMLGVRDSLEMGLTSAPEGEAGGPLREGLEVTLRLFDQSLERSGVEIVDPQGQAFDPEMHEAMATRPEEGVAEGTVLEVVQKGFVLNGRLLRPARVFVAS